MMIVMNALYRSPKIVIRTCVGMTSLSAVTIRLHQGSALSLLMFIILLDYISGKPSVGKAERLLYADDIAIRASSKEDLEEIVNQWYD